MNTSLRVNTLTTSFTRRLATTVSPETRGLIDLSDQHGWDFAVLGQAPMPDAPIRFGEWWIVPAEQDTSHIPTRALERVQAIFTAGSRPKGFVVVHEAPLLLPPPKQDEADTLQLSALTPKLKSALKVASGVACVLGTALVAITGLAVVALGALVAAAALAIPAMLAVGVAVVDPILIAVTKDGYWVEIDRWWS
jgi:hypothetical protein